MSQAWAKSQAVHRQLNSISPSWLDTITPLGTTKLPLTTETWDHNHPPTKGDLHTVAVQLCEVSYGQLVIMRVKLPE